MMDEPVCNWSGDSNNFNHRDNQQLKILSLNTSRGNRMKEVKIEKVFKIVKGFEEYACTEFGEVMKLSSGKVISQFLVGVPPYYSVNFTINGKSKQQRVHRVVAMAWLDNDDPVNKTQVNHIDGNKYNNHISNLEWVTPAQNQQHAVSTKLKGSGEELYNSALLDEQVHQICKLLLEGWTTKDIAEKFEIPRPTALKIRSGDVYHQIRCLYDIPVTSREDFSEATVRWVCEQINSGVADTVIAKNSSNKRLSPSFVKKVRYKIRYKSISNEYF